MWVSIVVALYSLNFVRVLLHQFLLLSGSFIVLSRSYLNYNVPYFNIHFSFFLAVNCLICFCNSYLKIASGTFVFLVKGFWNFCWFFHMMLEIYSIICFLYVEVNRLYSLFIEEVFDLNVDISIWKYVTNLWLYSWFYWVILELVKAALFFVLFVVNSILHPR